MQIFLTGATGFIGGALALALQERGDEVRALVRSPEKAQDLEAAGIELILGGLGDVDTIDSALAGCDAAIHNAAIYEVGIKKSQHPAMYASNVQGTENVLGAALRAKTPKVVYVSTVGAFGNTRGKVVDETYGTRTTATPPTTRRPRSSPTTRPAGSSTRTGCRA